MTDLLQIVTRYREDAGFSIVPVKTDGSKKPVGTWKEYQSQVPSSAELREWFGNGHRPGIALIHGTISGNSEVLDFDAPSAYEKFAGLCADHGLSALVDRCVLVDTPSGGVHLYYRQDGAPEGNQKLAQRRLPVEAGSRTEDELRKDGARQDPATGEWYKVETLIETRGEGGYTIAPGSPVEVHPDRKPYVKAPQNDFRYLPVFTAEERAALLAIARACNEYAEPEKTYRPRETPKEKRDAALGGLRPGDDYNARGDVLPILLKHGWQIAGQRGDVAHLTRPGKSIHEGISATVGHCGPGVLYVFSSSAAPFDMEHTYPPFSVYALLECGGDFIEAARRLGSEGYGDQTSAPVRRALQTQQAAKEEATPMPTDDDAPPAPAPRFQLTDDGNSLRLVARHGTDLRYCYAQGRWYVWDGNRWKRDDGDAIETRAKETARALLREAADLADAAEQKTLATHALRMQAYARVQAMIAMARSEVPVTSDQFDSDRWLLNCENGTLDLRTGKIRPHDRADLITKQAPVPYLPDASAPRWEAFLAQILPDAAVRSFLQRAVGYALTADVSEQCLFFLYGSGSNGKSTFIGAIMNALGDYAMQAAPDLLIAKEGAAGGPNNDVAELQGRRFVATVEVEDGKRMAEGLVKQITGGDRMKARFMREDFFEFTPSHKIFLAANHQPTIRGQDFAIWRRIKVVPFTVQIADEAKDTTLPDKLRAELPGILAWAVRGCLEWRRVGLQEPKKVKEATEEYREGQDILRDFLDDCCVINPTAQVTAADIFKAYGDWCGKNGEMPLGKKAFGQRLRERGAKPAIGVGPRKARGWHGVGLAGTPENMSLTSLTSHERETDELEAAKDASSDISDKSEPNFPMNKPILKPREDIGNFASQTSLMSPEDDDTLTDPFGDDDEGEEAA